MKHDDQGAAPLLGQWIPAAQGLTWVARVELVDAGTWLNDQEREVTAAAALAPTLAERMLASVEGEVSFAAGPDAALRSEFAAIKGFLEGQAVAAAAELGHVGELWQRVREDAHEVFDQLGALLEGGEIVTHGEGGRLVARSAVDWSGDITTAWRPGLRAWEVALHRENVGLALRAREAALAGIASAARGAARLAALIAAPAPTAASLMLPIAWRYLRRLWRG